MKASITTSLLLVLACSTNELNAQESFTTPPTDPEAIFERADEVDYSRFRLTLGGGFTTRLYCKDETASTDMQDFSKDLRSGVNGDFSGTYFYTRDFGIAVLANSFYSNTTEHVIELPSSGTRPEFTTLQGNASITFLGVAGSARYLSPEQKHSVIFHVGVGRYIYREMGKSNNDYSIKGNCAAILFSGAYDYYFNKFIGIGANVNYSAGKLEDAKVDVGNGTFRTVIESSQPLNRIDFSVGVRFLID